MSTDETKIHEAVRKQYGEYARTESSCCQPQNELYPAEMIADLPSDIANFSAGSGDPITPARLQPGETVLDLGSGGGLDCFLASRQVGKSGRVIGVDMTPEMLARAQLNAGRIRATNVEFREGLLEALPVEANSVDVIISNCVINLSPDKPKVFREMFRVLKPGGRMAVSDITTNCPVPEEKRQNMQEWCGCVSGALDIQDYEETLRRTGFVNIRIQPDLELVKRHLRDGTAQIQAEPGVDAAGLLEGGLEKLLEQKDKNVFLPSIITANKPA